ncbi:MAG: sulfotransferase [Deltaproteobacteria bacterium]|nr:sulfotransferase [Deltaproteobacteria bacterium]
MFNRVIIVVGAPRSGTSWLGQILDSCPSTKYRFQPLFSWAFKGALNERSSREDFEVFFRNIYDSNDEFLCQTERRKTGLYPTFSMKQPRPEVLVFKMIRYHFLVPVMIKHFQFVSAVGIVRHPCGAIYSWLSNCKEFPANANPLKEWRLGTCRNQNKPEEYWGFEAWKKISVLFGELSKMFPSRFRIVQYESMVDRPFHIVRSLFSFLDIPYTRQTESFLKSCHEKHLNDPYAVFKNKKVKDAWKTKLYKEIRAEIIKEIIGTDLEKFLVE